MKSSLKSLVAFAAIALTAVTSHAQTAPKILVVDLAKLFDSHWKTKEQQAKLQADEAKAQDQLAAITKVVSASTGATAIGRPRKPDVRQSGRVRSAPAHARNRGARAWKVLPALGGSC